ncbi:5-dehydro-2-deoxygluconokinase [Shouchella lehensis]|uniref:5-dehydro-2-deoxygluconokinase n=1 Tax=Shouchella lehensis G1 TaxID=1246626 RepID=A0A060LYI3_9BACI|nr:5-dehydro-2-deoxygluconokinase [Shouchella lehensis]AIC92864.1 2-deoxy-5-keto-D-gluconic acid kinase [Shouchella lehensis G1]
MTVTFAKDKRFDLVAIGRACIDLNATEYNRPMEETMTFSKYVGGSPANVAIGSSKLGLKTGFIGKLADDQHGRFIRSYMDGVGVDTSEMITDTEGHKTGLTFTEIKSPEECSILMYRTEVADLFLRPEEVSEAYIAEAKMLLVSGTALAQSPSREAVFQAVDYAKKNNVTIVFELDYRPYTWQSAEETSVYYKWAAEQANLVIGTRDEYDILENQENGDDEETAKALLAHRAELVVIKHGVDGSIAFEEDGTITRAKAYPSNVLKTFGAGDSYASAFLYALVNGKSTQEALQFGGASAAIVVSKHSSSEAMPTVGEIEDLLKQHEQRV